ncbi:pyridoxal-phosphate dependent enzyme [Saccharothrix violaceirubra]|uniref:threonine ammonia-lyase n=1 Tax=Saccharothrix violaceirubra TaxID=413306 RepID=A0A7W7T2Y4_9PSEU|nr:pyridoxal-phosphate dependent enzyme [Saccharothrix violaceirubra]MBB4965608.1 threonine dehydratase [Saccharothrix violaceirubra]
MTDLPTRADVEEAAFRIAGVVARTPVLHSPALDERTGGQVLLKCENLQHTGSFKVRGAANAVARLDPRHLARGVIAFSSGNHALAVATAAKAAGSPALLVMPSDAPAAKFAAVRGLGAEVVTFDRYTDDRFALTARLAAEHGLTPIPPYDHADVIAGAGTTTAEFLDQVGSLDVLAVPLGGGGQLAGATLVSGDVRLIGVETARGDKNRRSLQAGHRVRIPVPRTIADGVTGEIPGELTFPLVRRGVERVVVVDDDEIRAALAFLFEEVRLVVEPSGALAVAALLAGRLDVTGARAGVVLSGGNIDLARLHDLLA